jgi:cation diffusion facilitator family transporter
MNQQETSLIESAALARGNPATVKRVTWIGFFVNIALSAFKLLAGIFGHSQAMVADGVHSISDCATDIAVLIGVRYWSKPPDAGHPHGHKRIETIITTLIGAALAAVGVGIIVNALVTLKEAHNTTPSIVAFIAAIVSIGTKEGLYRWTVAVGRRIKSSAMVANAWHHRSDAFSSIPAAIAIAGARLIPKWQFLDHVGAVVVSVFILQAAWSVTWPALKQLVDAGAPRSECERLRQIALATPGVKVVHALRTRYIGSELQTDLHILVDPDLSVREGHDIAEDVKRRILAQGPDVVDVTVHVEPVGDGEET